MASKKSIRPPNRKSITPSRSILPKPQKNTPAREPGQTSICPVCGGEVVPLITDKIDGSIYISICDGAYCKVCKIRFESMPDPKIYSRLNR